MKKLYYLPFLFTVLIIFSGCSKDNKNANRIDGQTYNVTSISVDGAGMTGTMPTISFDDCRIYKENCSGMWTSGANSSQFFWQFREKGETFEISNQGQEATGATKEAIMYSGIYKVEENRRGTFRISSSNTLGHEGHNVMITMERN